MPWQDPRILKDLGYHPQGTAPSPLETIIKGTGQFVDSYFDAEEKRAKRAKDKLDAYITLRKAGYSEEQATDRAASMDYLGGGAPEKDVLGAETEVAMTKPEEARLGLKEKRATIAEKHAKAKKDTAYADAYKAGDLYFESEDEIPPEKDGIPLDSIAFVPGKGYKPNYKRTKKTAAEIEAESFDKMTADARAKKEAAAGDKIRAGDKGGGNWLTNFLGSFGKSAVSGPGPAGAAETKKPDTEAVIQANMKKYGKSRPEVIAAMKKKGLM